MKLQEILKPIFAIALSAGILFGAKTLLSETAEKRAEQERQTTMQQLLPGGETFTHEEYTGEDPSISAVYKSENGYVVEAAVEGYADDIVLWVGVENRGTVTGVTVREIAETPGLGKRALRDEAFLSQFLGTRGDAALGAEIDSLSGATVSSRAITKGVNSAVGFVTGADVTTSATEWGG